MTLFSQEPTQEQREHCLLLLARWQAKLNLHHWRIQLSDKQPSVKGREMEAAYMRLRRLCSIRIANETWEKPDFERKLVHELTHLVIDPVQEELEFALQSLPKDRQKEYTERFERRMEQAVEDMSYILYDSQP